eukprot:452315-Rhodomonas_salina.2
MMYGCSSCIISHSFAKGSSKVDPSKWEKMSASSTDAVLETDTSSSLAANCCGSWAKGCAALIVAASGACAGSATKVACAGAAVKGDCAGAAATDAGAGTAAMGAGEACC